MTRSFWVAGGCAILLGCAPKLESWATDYPAGVLDVRYEPATHFASCLVASVAMAASKVDGHLYNEPEIRRQLREAGLDETRPHDLDTWLATRRLDLLILAGRLDDRPPFGVEYWVMQRGYPAICIVNRSGEDTRYNHAIVVIGVQRKVTDHPGTTDTLYYLDPASKRGLETVDRETFEMWWSRGQRTMMVVVKPPAGVNKES